MRVLLATCPVADPTAPYHSLSYLSGYLKAHGFHDVDVRDLNIEWFNHAARQDTVRKLLQRAGDRKQELERKGVLKGLDKAEYFKLLLQQADGLEPEEPSRALEIMRSTEAFFEHEQYLGAVRTLEKLQRVMTAQSFPTVIENFGCRFDNGFSVRAAKDLGDGDAVAAVTRPFIEFAEAPLLR